MAPGAHLGAGEKVGLRNVASGLNEVFEAVKLSPVRIALDNTAGQGSCPGYDLKHLATIYDLVKQQRNNGQHKDPLKTLKTLRRVRAMARHRRRLPPSKTAVGVNGGERRQNAKGPGTCPRAFRTYAGESRSADGDGG